MYAKLINGDLQIAPNYISIDGNKIWNASADQMLNQGWKPVTYTSMPDPEAGFYFVAGWKETAKKISQTWTKVEVPDYVSDADALAELMEVIG